jgi:hypothetical protein
VDVPPEARGNQVQQVQEVEPVEIVLEGGQPGHAA